MGPRLPQAEPRGYPGPLSPPCVVLGEAGRGRAGSHPGLRVSSALGGNRGAGWAAGRGSPWAWTRWRWFRQHCLQLRGER